MVLRRLAVQHGFMAATRRLTRYEGRLGLGLGHGLQYDAVAVAGVKLAAVTTAGRWVIRGLASSQPQQQQQDQKHDQEQRRPTPTISTCPSPTCACAEMPTGLDIDTTSGLAGAMPTYAEQVLVCTGQDDWPSRIEEERGGDNLAADLKELIGRGGEFNDPFYHISVLNASFPSTPAPRPEAQSTSAYLLPSFKYVPLLPRVSFEGVRALAKGYLLAPASTLHSAHAALSPLHRDRLTRAPAAAALLPGVRDVDDVLVLVCGHGGRDARCGVMGPLLRDEFVDKLGRVGVRVLRGPVGLDVDENGEAGADVRVIGGEGRGRHDDDTGNGTKMVTARVGLVSHIGGHKFAGNIIIYIPPTLQRLYTNHSTGPGNGKDLHALAGTGIWYGRVQPRHVEGLVRETVLRGRVVADLFRGGMNMQRRQLRI